MATIYSISYKPFGDMMYNHTIHKSLRAAENEAKRVILKHKFAVYVQVWEHRRGKKKRTDKILKVM